MIASPGNRYTQLLTRQPNLNNGTNAGGLAHMLQQFMVGREMGQQRADDKRRRKGLADALRAMTVATPSGGAQSALASQGPGMMAVAPGAGSQTGASAGNAGAASPRMAMIQALAESNPELALQMANQDYAQRQQEQSARDMYMFQQKNKAQSPTDEERLAAAMGLSPGTPEYMAFIRDAVTNGTSAPSTVREWEFFNRLDPESQKQYLLMKRAAPSPFNLGDRIVPVDPRTAQPQPQGFAVGAPPKQTVQPDRIVTTSGVPGGAPVGGNMIMGGGGAPVPPAAGQPANPTGQPSASARQPGGTTVTDLPLSPKDRLEADRERFENQSAYTAFSVGLKNVTETMAQTDTGPLMGRLPAVSAEAQTAEGAAATLAPVLKSLFRTAGEGTFTDKDQELLMKMVPTREDLPAAREAKIRMIDEMVRAKLGIGAPATAPAPESDRRPTISDGPSANMTGIDQNPAPQGWSIKRID